jgi:hypothetical protein
MMARPRSFTSQLYAKAGGLASDDALATVLGVASLDEKKLVQCS